MAPIASGTSAMSHIAANQNNGWRACRRWSPLAPFVIAAAALLIGGRSLADDGWVANELPATAQDLDVTRGRALPSTTVTSAGDVSANTATNTVSGENSIGEGAFTGASGLPIVIQNSGNNVLIQNNVVLNVTIR